MTDRSTEIDACEYCGLAHKGGVCPWCDEDAPRVAALGDTSIHLTHDDLHDEMRDREHLAVCPVCNLDLTSVTPPGADDE
ncbi:MAG TPA: hypothetical protein VFK41_06530 [Nocardioidaceae bacterium]|nr:hypothetical protein [Nocardioidaceae bacterium]